MANAYFFRVGMDTTTSIKKPQKGIEFPLGYVFTKEKNDFIYLPLLKYKPCKDEFREKLTKSFKIGNKTIFNYICSEKELMDIWIHYDPCFNKKGEFSYGDASHSFNEKSKSYRHISKALNLEKLKEGDLLVFCEILVEFKNKNEVFKAKNRSDFLALQKKRDTNLYVIGYFIVDKIVVYNSPQNQNEKRIQIENLFKNNAHIIEREHEYDCSEQNLILVKGKNSSKLLKKAIKIAYTGNNCYNIDPNSGFEKFIGNDRCNYHFYKFVSLDKNQLSELKSHIDRNGF